MLKFYIILLSFYICAFGQLIIFNKFSEKINSKLKDKISFYKLNIQDKLKEKITILNNIFYNKTKDLDNIDKDILIHLNLII